jgi:glutaminyl-tRNA synthetase
MLRLSLYQVVLTNVPEQHCAIVSGATQPGRPENQPYPLPVSRVVYIEATDFRLQDSKDYYGLAPGKSAMLR